MVAQVCSPSDGHVLGEKERFSDFSPQQTQPEARPATKKSLNWWPRIIDARGLQGALPTWPPGKRKGTDTFLAFQ